MAKVYLHCCWSSVTHNTSHASFDSTKKVFIQKVQKCSDLCECYYCYILFKNPPGFHLIFSKWGSSYVGTGCPVLATFFRHFPSPLSSLSSTTNILRGFQANTNLLSRLPHPPFKTTNGRKKLITSLAPGPISHKFQRLYRTRQPFSTVDL